MDPCIFFRINKDDNTNKVTGYLVAITWVDDCHYFGTSDLVADYEKTLSENCKCTLEGVAKEFVSIQIHPDPSRREGEDTRADAGRLLGKGS